MIGCDGRCRVPLTTVEGIVENGRIRLREDIALPERTRVYVIIPDVQPVTSAHVRSPRLADPRRSADFRKQVVEGADDAGV